MSLLFSPFWVPADLGGQFSEMLVSGGFAETGTVSAELRETECAVSEVSGITYVSERPCGKTDQEELAGRLYS